MGKGDWEATLAFSTFHVKACECKVAIVILMGCGLDVTSWCSK
jgi:hypothetical protein